MVTTRKGENTAHEIRVDGKMLDDMNNFQHIRSNRIKRLQYRYVVQETFSHCDRITDKTLPIMFPMEKVRSEAASVHTSPRRPTRIRRDDPPAVGPTATHRF